MAKFTLTHAGLLAAVLGAATAAQSAAQAADMSDAPKAAGKEKCYGVAKKGENACGSANGSHGCAGEAKIDYDGMEYKDVPKGTCELMKGSLKPFEGANPKLKS